MKASRWFYYTVPADLGDYQVSLTSDRDVSVYIRRGTTDVPDTVNFDAVIKDDTEISFNSQMFKNLASQGVIFAVHCVGETSDTTNFSVQLEQLENTRVINSFEFLDLAATAVPSSATPVPQFEPNEEGGKNGGDGSSLQLTNIHFMIIGSFLGIIATVIYYQVARFC